MTKLAHAQTKKTLSPRTKHQLQRRGQTPPELWLRIQDQASKAKEMLSVSNDFVSFLRSIDEYEGMIDRDFPGKGKILFMNVHRQGRVPRVLDDFEIISRNLMPFLDKVLAEGEQPNWAELHRALPPRELTCEKLSEF